MHGGESFRIHRDGILYYSCGLEVHTLQISVVRGAQHSGLTLNIQTVVLTYRVQTRFLYALCAHCYHQR